MTRIAMVGVGAGPVRGAPSWAAEDVAAGAGTPGMRS